MIDLLYLCHGRLEFTKATLTTLLANTNWDIVNEFVVYNDAAPDNHNTTRYLKQTLPPTATFRQTNLASPVAVMNHFIWRSEADMFAKVDNDIVVPPDWLDCLAEVMEHDESLMLLGMEGGQSALRAPHGDYDGCYTWTPCSHIGGVGLMRRDVFQGNFPRPNGRFGFTEWQARHQPLRGWIEPDLKTFSLDKVPLAPWEELTQRYVSEGLNRPWPPYPKEHAYYYEWWVGEQADFEEPRTYAQMASSLEETTVPLEDEKE